MAYNYYFNEKLAVTHRQNLLREAAQQELVARLPRRRFRLLARLAAQAGILLVALGTQLKQFEQRGEAVEHGL